MLNRFSAPFPQLGGQHPQSGMLAPGISNNRDLQSQSRVAPPLVASQPKAFTSRGSSASSGSIHLGSSSSQYSDSGRPTTPTNEYERGSSKLTDYDERSTKSTEQKETKNDGSDLRAEAAENRLLRAMAHFSVLAPTSSRIMAKRNASFTIATISSRNEMDQLSLWEDFATSSPVQYLNAELMTPSEAAELRSKQDEYEMRITLVNGSLNVKLLPDLSVTQVQRMDVDCQEGDKIVSADGIPVSTVEELRIALKGKSEILLLMARKPKPLLSIIEGSSTYWVVDKISATTTVLGSLKQGDLILRVNDSAVTGLDPLSALARYSVTLSFLPAESALAQRIKRDGLMSFSTKVEASISKERGKAEPKYNIILTRFEPDMYAGVYIAGVFLGRYQIGENFSLEIEEGPANANLSRIVREGSGPTLAGVPIEFTLIGYDEAGNAKCAGGDEIVCENATVTDPKNGSYKISYLPTKVGVWKIDVFVNGEAKKGAIECEVLPADVCLAGGKCDFLGIAHGQSLRSKPGESGAHFSVVAGNSVAVTVTLYDKYGNLRPRAKDTVALVQRVPTFKGVAVGAEAPLTPVGQGLYEYQGLVTLASLKDAAGNVQYSPITILVNGLPMREEPWTLDVLPGDLALKRCLSTVTAAGVVAVAGRPFEFDVLVKDQWDNNRNRCRDTVELYEFDNSSKQSGDRWRDYEVVASGHGTYRVTARSTLARQSLFTFSINGNMTPNAGCVHLLDVSPNAVSIPHCVITGQTTAVVGQYIQLMVSLRDEFGNIARPAQLASLEITVENVMMMSGNIDPSEVKLINRISRVDPVASSTYTHQILLSTQQALQLKFDVMLGVALLHKSTATFLPERLDPRSCVVENVPRCVVAGEEFTVSMWLTDSFRNGLSGLEGLVAMVPRDPKDAASLIKTGGKELGKGRYLQSYRLVKASSALPVAILHGQEPILSASVEVLPAKAKARTCEIVAPAESPCFVPLLLRVVPRDEFGNLGLPDDTQIVLELDRAMKPSRSGFFVDSGGGLVTVVVPKTAGELRVQVSVNDEPAGELTVAVTHLSVWTKEDARAWLETLRPVQAQVGAVIPSLASEFIRQNVSGAKIVAGLLDRGALHFAFGLDERMAEFFASLMADLNRGPDLYPNAYLPWSWTTIGIPGSLGSLPAGDDANAAVARRLQRSIPNCAVVAVERFESANLYEHYYASRRAVGFLCGGDCSECYLWYGPEGAAGYQGVMECGFSGAKLMSERALGRGFYFHPDPRLAEAASLSIGGDGSATPPPPPPPPDTPRRLILARVVCGVIGVRDPLTTPAHPLGEELRRLEGRMPPAGSQSATGRQRTELVVFRDHMAYPEYVVTYTYLSGSSELAPETILKIDDVQAGL